MRSRRFKQVDVFGATPYKGNPVAVVVDAEGLDASTMHQIARWTNLSETTFLQPATKGGDYGVRIFTPGGELPFAGHPTIGSAHAAIEAGLASSAVETLTQECGMGLVPLTIGRGPVESRVISFELPRARVVQLSASARAELSAIVGLELSAEDAATIDVGPAWVIADMGSADRVHAFHPEMDVIDRFSRTLSATGITIFGRGGAGEPVYVRSFAPSCGIPEDPVCGSGNGSVGEFLLATGRFETIGAQYEASQGIEIGRDGRIFVTLDPAASHVYVGGSARTLIDGRIDA